MDIASIQPGERAVEITHPASGEPLGIKVSVISINDERMTKITRTLTNRGLELRKKNKTPSAEDVENNQIALLQGAVVDWNWGDNKFHGSVPEFTPENVRKVLTELKWFRAQLDEALGDERGFF